ncbi:hypothetical protein VTK56DRAFT_7137 [Thermocarpiscus australiensis]
MYNTSRIRQHTLSYTSSYEVKSSLAFSSIAYSEYTYNLAATVTGCSIRNLSLVSCDNLHNGEIELQSHVHLRDAGIGTAEVRP